MKWFLLALPLCAVLPLSAQTWEVGVFGGRQSYPAPSAEQGPLGLVSGTSESFSTPGRNVVALRAGWWVLEMGPARLQIALAYQPATSSAQMGTLYQDYPTNPTQTNPYKAGYSAVGAMVTYRFFVDLGLGLDYRIENLSSQGQSTTYDRPWVRATVDWSFPLPAFKPFVGVEAAYPLTTTTLQLAGAFDNALEAAAPRSQLGIHAGIRF